MDGTVKVLQWMDKSGHIPDVALVGEIDKIQLDDFVAKTEAYIERKIRSLVLSRDEFHRLKDTKGFKPILRLWEQGNRDTKFQSPEAKEQAT